MSAMGSMGTMGQSYPTWVKEFAAEMAHDHRELLDCRKARKDRGDWNFDHAVLRTQEFYRARIDGYHTCMSITDAERDYLHGLIDALGSERFPV